MGGTRRHDDVRQDADWMVPADDKILEAMRDEGNLTPRAVEDVGATSRDYAAERLPILARYGLVERFSRGLYRITDAGHAYLDESLDASELEPSESTE